MTDQPMKLGEAVLTTDTRIKDLAASAPAVDEKQRDAVRARNQQRMQLLAQQGVQINLLPQYVDFLADALLDPDDRLRFSIEWEAQVAKILDDVDTQIRMATLTQGLRP